jgi:hypothetical protein
LENVISFTLEEERIILKWIVKELGRDGVAGLIWLRVEYSGRL